MEKLILLVVLTFPLIGIAQKFSFITDSDSIYVSVAGLGEKYFLTSAGNISYTDVRRAYLHGEITDYYREKFRERNIPLFSADATKEGVQTTLKTGPKTCIQILKK